MVYIILIYQVLKFQYTTINKSHQKPINIDEMLVEQDKGNLTFQRSMWLYKNLRATDEESS